MVVGGQAVLLYGEPRFTRDIDITLGVEPSESAAVMAMVRKLNLRILAKNADEFLQETWVLPVIDPATEIRVDFVFSLSQFERAAIEHANVIDLDGVSVRFASLEDLVVMKVVASRPRDLEDVASIIRKNPQADFSYIEAWLRKFDAELESDFSSIFRGLVKKT